MEVVSRQDNCFVLFCFLFVFCCWFFFVFVFFSLRCFNILCYASGFYMLLFLRQMFLTRARACVCMCCSLALYSAIEHVYHGKAL